MDELAKDVVKLTQTHTHAQEAVETERGQKKAHEKKRSRHASGHRPEDQ